MWGGRPRTLESVLLRGETIFRGRIGDLLSYKRRDTMKTIIMVCSIAFVLSAFTGSALGGEEGDNFTSYGKGAGNSTILRFISYPNEAFYNTFIGRNAGYNTTGKHNTFLGHCAGSDNKDGNRNTFLGAEAGVNNTTGSWNTFLGMRAGVSNHIGYGNTFIGYTAGYSNDGLDNTFIGYSAGYHNVGKENTLIGSDAGYYSEDSSYNTFIGNHAGLKNKTGNDNTFIGHKAGQYATGANNVFLGYKAGYHETGSHKLYIANLDTSNPLIYGEFDNDILVINGKVGINIQPTADPYPLQVAGGAYCDGTVWHDGSSREYKEKIKVLGLEEAVEALKELSPVQFELKRSPSEQHVGFIAEDVPELVATKDRKGLSPMDIVAVLTKVVQEQQETISELSEKVAELEQALKTQGY
jgi:hypothetical protein